MTFPYPSDVEVTMRLLFSTLGERERRLYAAAEAMKLGQGGLAYISSLLDCDEKTIRRGKRELDQPQTLPPGRSRKKGVAARTS